MAAPRRTYCNSASCTQSDARGVGSGGYVDRALTRLALLPPCKRHWAAASARVRESQIYTAVYTITTTPVTPGIRT